MLQPARTKYRKQQKGRNTGVATRGAKVSFGEFGLKAVGLATRRGLRACSSVVAGASGTAAGCSLRFMISPLNTQTLTPMMP